MSALRRNHLIKLISWLVVLMIYISLAAVILVQKDQYMKDNMSIQQIKNNIYRLRDENKDIKIELAEHQKLEYIERKAKEELNMYYPNDITFLKKEKVHAK